MKISRSTAEALRAAGVLPQKGTTRERKTRKKAPLTSLPPPSETEIVRQCREFLELHGAVVIRNNTGAVKIEDRLVHFGEPGSSDLIVCLKGRYVACEAKRPGEKLKPSQAAWLDLVSRAGGLALMVRGVDELQRALRKEGLLE